MPAPRSNYSSGRVDPDYYAKMQATKADPGWGRPRMDNTMMSAAAKDKQATGMLAQQRGQMAPPQLALQGGQDPTLANYIGTRGDTLGFDKIGNNLDQSGLDAMKTRALGKGPSAWLSMANKQQGLEEKGQINNAALTSQSQANQARAGLAMRGGLRGGAAERLGGQAAEQNLMARQDVFNQGAQTRAGLGMQDETIKMDMLKQLPGAQLAAAGYKTDINKFNSLGKMDSGKFNIGNQIADLQGQNKYNFGKYGEEMRLKGANKSADAMRSANDSSGPLSWLGIG